MKVAIRTDASIWIGSGHVMRCLVLAEELRRLSNEVVFVCLPQKGDKIELIQEKGFSVIKLNPPDIEIIPRSSDDYLAWLQRPVDIDAQDFINNVNGSDLVITDHYAIEYSWQCQVKEALNCKLVAIDDLVRRHDADLIIDQTLGRLPEEYGSDNNVLSGSDYALLNPLFYKSRNKALKRKSNYSHPRILVSMGGVDQPNATIKVLRALVDYKAASFTVLLSSAAPHYQEVVNFCSNNKKVEHIDFVQDMAQVMLAHDLAIGAPGSTSWERACLGLPSIVIPIADNQTEITQKLIDNDVAIYIDLNTLESDLGEAVDTLLSRSNKLREAGFKACDGLGVYRVISEIIRLSSSSLVVRLIKATKEDIELVYKWQCSSETRKHALNPDLPTWEEHQSWMKDKLSSYEDFFYIIINVDTGIKTGVLRLDKIKDEHYLVSIFVAPEHYSKGVARAALQVADSIHSMVTLHATVLKDNIASQCLFEKARYQRLTPEKFIRRSIT